jgi:hypothetical protein
MSDCSRISTGLIPLTNPEGVGLYEGGNTRPTAHTEAGIAAAQAIAGMNPLVFVGIGMSVTKQAFQRFRSRAEGRTAPNVLLVNCAAGGHTSEEWSDWPEGWKIVDSKLTNAGVTANDVYVAWMKLTRSHPTGPVEAFIEALTTEWRAAIQHAATKFPNLRQLFVGCRSYGGYDDQFYNTEPYAHATGLVAKQMVLESIANPSQRPWVDWGPYFWTDGMTPRAGDGLIWRCDPNPYKNGVPTYRDGDVTADGVHQTGNGENKEVDLLLPFFETDVTTTWFNGR